MRLFAVFLLMFGCRDPKEPQSGDSAAPVDADGDGATGDADCDDADPAVHVGATETCDGVDQDCDGETDDGATDATTWYADGDADGYGDAALSLAGCEAPAGYVATDTDCDDADGTVHPAAQESCDDTADRNCDGSVGDADADGDGWVACLDCDETSAGANPDAVEVCDDADVDEDCSGAADDDDPGVTDLTWFRDYDGDGFAEGTEATLTQCEAPTGYAVLLGDCDIYEANVSPMGSEVCDADDADEDCDGLVDDADGSVSAASWSSFWSDDDGDGYGAGSAITACDAPVGMVANEDDCDDGDAARSPAATEACDEADADEDCDGLSDDADPSVTGVREWYADRDGDTYGDSAAPMGACSQPPGYVTGAGDCDDTEADTHPGRTEACDAANVDEDCDGNADDADSAPSGGTTWYADADGDGYGVSAAAVTWCDAPIGYAASDGDCDEGNASVNPGAAEVCDVSDTDEDCDGAADDDDSGVTARTTWFRDSDGDTYGSSTVTVTLCEQPTGYVGESGDCDDASAATSPAGSEVCDGADADEDCDGTADDADGSATGQATWYADADADGYGDATFTRAACDAPSGYVATATDCDDGSASISPASSEVCDAANVDEDCDGLADDLDSSAAGGTSWYPDADADGYGVATSTTSACDAPSGFASASGDCDDTSSSTHPGAAEVCDASDVDENCDGAIDDADASVSGTTRWYRDLDGDGFGNSATTRDRCAQPTGYVEPGTDCDDADADINPGEAEICDASDIDEDCDGAADDSDTSAIGQTTWHIDVDGDGYGSITVTSSRCEQPSGYLADGTDCDDGSSTTNPAATETCDDIDEDCDGAADDGLELYYPDYDGDGYGDEVEPGVCTPFSPSATLGGDCDELDDTINPGADEVCNGVDDDCDDDLDDDDSSLAEPAWYTDVDGDGYGVTSSAVIACSAPAGTAADPDDCDDTDAYANPGMVEIYGDAIDDDCDDETMPVGTYCTPNVTTASEITAELSSSGLACLPEGTITGNVSGEGTIAGQGPGRSFLVGDVTLGNTVTIESLAVIGYVDATSTRTLSLSDCELRTTDVYALRTSYGRLSFTMEGCEVSGATSYGLRLVASSSSSGSGTVQITNSWFHDNDTAVMLYPNASYGARQTLYAYLYNNTFNDNDTRAIRAYGDSDSWIYLNYYNNVFYDTGVSLDDSYTILDEGSNSTVTSMDDSYSPPRPVSGSSLIGGADVLYAPSTDFWGQTRDSTPDIGAVEY